jgi:hypothetical protein
VDKLGVDRESPAIGRRSSEGEKTNDEKEKQRVHNNCGLSRLSFEGVELLSKSKAGQGGGDIDRLHEMRKTAAIRAHLG